MRPFASLSPLPGSSSQTVFWIRPSDSCPLFSASLSLDGTHQQGLENGFAVGPEQKARPCYFLQHRHSLHPHTLTEKWMYLKQLQKVNGPPQTKEIKFGNLAVTGVLWLCSDHTGGDCSRLTRCSVCLPVGFELCGDKDEICLVFSSDKNVSDLVDLEVIVESVFGLAV